MEQNETPALSPSKQIAKVLFEVKAVQLNT
jgi:hypothetical protein